MTEISIPSFDLIYKNENIVWMIILSFKVEVFIDGNQVVVWKGLLGRNDEHGAFMKYGIYAPKNTTNITIQFKGAHSTVYN